MKKVWQIISVVLVIALALGMTAFAEGDVGTENSKVVFSVDENDDLVSVTLEVRKTSFTVLQAAVRYNAEVVEPIDAEGKLAERFKDFATISEEASFFNSIGLSLEKEKGLFGFTLFVMPGTEDELVNETSECIADENGVRLYTFSFRRIAEGDLGFELAVENEEKVFQSILPEGIIIMNNKAGKLSVDVSVEEVGKESVTITVIPETLEDVSGPVESADGERKKDVIALKINASTAYAYGKTASIDPDNSKVVPYLKNDRTLVPLRFVSETLGAEVKWENGWDYCYVVKGDKKIKITFNSADIEVNGQVVTYDAPVEVVQERTMVPIRFISEELGYDVKWNQANQLVIITPADNPWVEDRQVEKDVLEGILVTFLFNGIF